MTTEAEFSTLKNLLELLLYVKESGHISHPIIPFLALGAFCLSQIRRILLMLVEHKENRLVGNITGGDSSGDQEYLMNS